MFRQTKLRGMLFKTFTVFVMLFYALVFIFSATIQIVFQDPNFYAQTFHGIYKIYLNNCDLLPANLLVRIKKYYYNF